MLGRWNTRDAVSFDENSSDLEIRVTWQRQDVGGRAGGPRHAARAEEVAHRKAGGAQVVEHAVAAMGASRLGDLPI